MVRRADTKGRDRNLSYDTNAVSGGEGEKDLAV